jgi:hypothetical protein
VRVCVFVASAESEVRLLTLSKEDYDEIKDRYPEVTSHIEPRDPQLDSKHGVKRGTRGQLSYIHTSNLCLICVSVDVVLSVAWSVDQQCTSLRGDQGWRRRSVQHTHTLLFNCAIIYICLYLYNIYIYIYIYLYKCIYIVYPFYHNTLYLSHSLLESEGAICLSIDPITVLAVLLVGSPVCLHLSSPRRLMAYLCGYLVCQMGYI